MSSGPERQALDAAASGVSPSDQLLVSDVPGIGRPLESLAPLGPAMDILAIDQFVVPTLPFLAYIPGSSIARHQDDPCEILRSFEASEDYVPELSRASRTVAVVGLRYQRVHRRFSIIADEPELLNGEYASLIRQNPAYRVDKLLRIRIAKFRSTSYDRAERFAARANIWLPAEITLGPLMVQPY